MTHRPTAEMPETIRHTLRAKQHPARGVDCPHCAAHAHRPCRSQSKVRTLTQPHPSRISAWVRSIACCPACQVEPGIDCHQDGRALHDGAVHPQRETEAQVVAA